MAITLLQQATTPSLGMTQGATVYCQCTQTRLGQSASPGTGNERTVRAAGVFSKMYMRVFSNGVSATTTVRFRKNVGDGNQNFSVTAGSTGEFIDSTNTDTVIATDEVNIQVAIGAGGTTFNPCILSLLFNTTSNNTYCLNSPGVLNMTSPSASTTYYFSMAGGFNALVTTEANVQVRMRSSGTFKNFFVIVTTNGRSTNTVFRSRKNTADGNMVLTFTGSSTGVQEELVLNDSFVYGDLLNYSATTGTGTGNIVAQGGASTETTNGTMPLAGHGGVTISALNTRYFTTTGQIVASVTEATTRSQLNHAFMGSRLQIYISANTITAASTFRLRKNGANANQVITIPASTTGWLEDTANSDFFNVGDEMSYSVVAGATGTSFVIETIVMLFSAWLPRRIGIGFRR